MEHRISAFRQAAGVLPPGLRGQVMDLSWEDQGRGEELRLRAGFPVSVVFPEGERSLGGKCVEPEELELLLERASGASVHSVLEQLREGFVTIAGGHRIGFCGTTVVEQGGITFLRDLSSACVRVARQFPGLAREVAPRLFEDGVLQSTLILAPPGGGKTSLLRDLIRTLSDGEGVPAHRIGVVDPRGELGAAFRGKAQLDLGSRTDLLNACPKAQGLLLLLRSMNPQVLAVDEVTAPEDVLALLDAAGCGVALLATVHGGDRGDLKRRKLYRDLLSAGVFRRLVTIAGRGAQRRYSVEVLE